MAPPLPAGAPTTRPVIQLTVAAWLPPRRFPTLRGEPALSTGCNVCTAPTSHAAWETDGQVSLASQRAETLPQHGRQLTLSPYGVGGQPDGRNPAAGGERQVLGQQDHTPGSDLVAQLLQPRTDPVPAEHADRGHQHPAQLPAGDRSHHPLGGGAPGRGDRNDQDQQGPRIRQPRHGGRGMRAQVVQSQT